MSTTTTAHDVGTQLLEMIQQGKSIEAIEHLYADNVVSIEAVDGCDDNGMQRIMEGKEAILGKNKWFYENIEVHSASAEGPFPHQPDRFALILKMDCTCTQTGKRNHMEEVAIYTVADGKIVKEEFFYSMPGQ